MAQAKLAKDQHERDKASEGYEQARYTRDYMRVWTYAHAHRSEAVKKAQQEAADVAEKARLGAVAARQKEETRLRQDAERRQKVLHMHICTYAHMHV